MFVHGRRDVADVFTRNLEVGPGRPSVIQGPVEGSRTVSWEEEM